MSDPFQLDVRLANDTFDLGKLQLSRLLLMNDQRFPWCILVPEIADLKDLHEIPASQRQAVFDEIDRLSRILSQHCKILHGQSKMNVAALGNMVPQLHIHLIARHQDDVAWPGSVWGKGEPIPYTTKQATEFIASIKKAL